MIRLRAPLVPALVAVALLGTAGCAGTAASAQSAPGRIGVSASFYPLAYAVEQIGGSHVEVTSLTKPGAEPHEIELSPQDVVAMRKAALVVYEKGFQPAVDDAVAQVGSHAALDVSGPADLTLVSAEPDGHTEEGAATKDPHFWLDPQRYAAVAEVVGRALAARDPAHAAAYAQGTKDFVGRLDALDATFRTGLAHCADKDLVTGHAAFGYLAARYGLTQVPIAGVSPDAEPNAGEMRDIVTQIRRQHVRTVYAEVLVSPALVSTIARETGTAVKVLDPVEGITKESAGRDYFAVMGANLATLRDGQDCA